MASKLRKAIGWSFWKHGPLSLHARAFAHVLLQENIRSILSKNLGLVEAMMDPKDLTIFMVMNDHVQHNS